MNSGAHQPADRRAEQTLAKYIITSASMKFGMAMPRKPSSDSP